MPSAAWVYGPSGLLGSSRWITWHDAVVSMQWPRLHDVAAEHAVVQSPQCWLSDFGSTQVLPHTSWFDWHTTPLSSPGGPPSGVCESFTAPHATESRRNTNPRNRPIPPWYPVGGGCWGAAACAAPHPPSFGNASLSAARSLQPELLRRRAVAVKDLKPVADLLAVARVVEAAAGARVAQHARRHGVP